MERSLREDTIHYLSGKSPPVQEKIHDLKMEICILIWHRQWWKQSSYGAIE